MKTKQFLIMMMAVLMLPTVFTSCGGSDDDIDNPQDVTFSFDVIRPFTDWNGTIEDVKAWGERNALTFQTGGNMLSSDYVGFTKNGGFPFFGYYWTDGKMDEVTVTYLNIPSREAGLDLISKTAKMLGVTFKPVTGYLDDSGSDKSEMGEASFRGDSGQCYVTYVLTAVPSGGWGLNLSYSPDGY